MTAIATDLLTKFYGSHRGIEDVTMAVEEGEVFGFLGPNGAGKTTTIRTLLDLLHPTGGSARILGLDTARQRRDPHPDRQSAWGFRVRKGRHRASGRVAARSPAWG